MTWTCFSNMSKKQLNMDISVSGGQCLQQGRVPINELPAALLTYQDADLFQCAEVSGGSLAFSDTGIYHSRFAHFGSGFQELTLDGCRSLPSVPGISCEGTILLHTSTMTEFTPSEQGRNCMVDCGIIGHTA